MIKRAVLALAFLALATVAHAAGTIPGFSLTPQFDQFGKIAPGCKLYVIQAGTTSAPQPVYQDTGLTVSRPNPMTCDSAGRLPQWFVTDGLIKLRLTDKNGIQIYPLGGDSGDNLLVLGPSSGGGGGGGTIDPTTIFTTGDVKAVYGTGTITGWVRANGRTIGSAISGATERANSDTQALFTWLYNSDPSLAVSGGRGANAAADWAANKTIAVPDARGRVMAALDDMGNTAAGRLTSSYFGATATTLGAAGGTESYILTTNQIPSHSHTVTDPGHSHTYNSNTGPNSVSAGTAGFLATNQVINTSGSMTGISINNTGGGLAHPIVQPTILVTCYIKL